MNFTAPPEYTRPKFLEWADAHIPYDPEDATWLGKRNTAYASWNEAWKQSTAEQTALIESLQNRLASRPLSVEDTAALEAENDKLTARVAAADTLADAVDAYNMQKLLWKPAIWAPVAEALAAYRARSHPADGARHEG